MKNTLALSFVVVATFGPAEAEPVSIADLDYSDIVAVGVANGASSSEVLELLDEFPGVSAFESKRLKEKAVTEIMNAGSSIPESRFPEVEIIYMAAVSQFDFESSSFGVCFPTAIGEDFGMRKDIPLRDLVELRLDKGAFARDARSPEGRHDRRGSHPTDMYTKDFYWLCQNTESTRSTYFSSFPIVFNDVAKAEDFDAMVEFGGGGYVTARVRCLLSQVNIQGHLIGARCQPTEVALFHVSDTEFSNPEFEMKFE